MSAPNNNNYDKSVFAPQVVSQRAVQVVEHRAAHPNEGIRTGIDRLDRELNPHRPGELRIVLGYTGNYKSGLMNYVARHNAKVIRDNGQAERRAVVTVTWEQSIEEQGIVDIAQLAVLDTTKMMRGELSETEWIALKRAATQRGKLPWWLIGHSSETNERRPRLSMSDLARCIEFMIDVQKIEPVLIVLDYLQRIRRDQGDTMREQFMTIVDRAKDMALAYHAPVMLGTQAGRQVKERKWRLPQVEDGQETSNLEQSADSLVSVWMPKNDYPAGTPIDYGDVSLTVSDNLLVLGVLKQKFGPSPRILPLHVKPEVNEIYAMETRP